MSEYTIIVIIAASLIVMALLLFYLQRFAFAFAMLILGTWHTAIAVTVAIGQTFDPVIFTVALIATGASVFGLIFTDKIEQLSQGQYDSQFEKYKAERKEYNSLKKKDFKKKTLCKLKSKLKGTDKR